MAGGSSESRSSPRIQYGFKSHSLSGGEREEREGRRDGREELARDRGAYPPVFLFFLSSRQLTDLHVWLGRDEHQRWPTTDPRIERGNGDQINMVPGMIEGFLPHITCVGEKRYITRHQVSV